MGKPFDSILADHNTWIVWVFLWYTFLVFAFGKIYHLLYQKNRNAFSFNSDIARAQSRSVEFESRRQLERLASQLAVLQQLRDELRAVGASVTTTEPHREGDRDGGTATIKGPTLEFTVAKKFGIPANPFAGSGMPPSTDLYVATPAGTRVAAISTESLYKCPKTAAEFQALCDDWTNVLEENSAKVLQIIENLKVDSQNIWSYWDFLYFSAMTQFTVGYGDILPNSTPVRLVVVLQAAIAVTLLVVVINIAFQGGTT
jgi:hypothetical protein